MTLLIVIRSQKEKKQNKDRGVGNCRRAVNITFNRRRTFVFWRCPSQQSQRKGLSGQGR